ELNQQRKNKKNQSQQKELYWLIVFIIKNITIQNKQTIFTEDQVPNLRDQCNLLKQSLSLMHPLHQFYYYFLKIEEKMYHQIVNLKEKMQKKYELIRLINQQQKQKSIIK
ncbi:hypothetical protein TTHERM_001285920, partial (macronuclear) [Tetrahymena thermophila SB210]